MILALVYLIAGALTAALMISHDHLKATGPRHVIVAVLGWPIVWILVIRNVRQR